MEDLIGMIPTIEWVDATHSVKMIDQTRLPQELTFLHLTTYQEIATAIKEMNIRGAPAIGVAAAMGMALAAQEFQTLSSEEFVTKMDQAGQILAQTRPTAVNLFWAIARIQKLYQEKGNDDSPQDMAQQILTETKKMWQEDIDINRAMGKHGAAILQDGDTVLTHCNAGSLATVLYGTALAPIRWAIEEEGKHIEVIADETRPRLQGARLTAWELQYDNIPVQVEPDSNAGLMMRLGKIQKIIVGSDRIVRDVVFNKIGTYMVAIAAHYHHIPFYVVAPRSTLSMNEEEKDVKIEQRDGDFEVARIMGRVKSPITPAGVNCINYAFDATPMDLVTGIITEDGLFTPEELVQKYT